MAPLVVIRRSLGEQATFETGEPRAADMASVDLV